MQSEQLHLGRQLPGNDQGAHRSGPGRQGRQPGRPQGERDPRPPDPRRHRLPHLSGIRSPHPPRGPRALAAEKDGADAHFPLLQAAEAGADGEKATAAASSTALEAMLAAPEAQPRRNNRASARSCTPCVTVQIRVLSLLAAGGCLDRLRVQAKEQFPRVARATWPRKRYFANHSRRSKCPAPRAGFLLPLLAACISRAAATAISRGASAWHKNALAANTARFLACSFSDMGSDSICCAASFA